MIDSGRHALRQLDEFPRPRVVTAPNRLPGQLPARLEERWDGAGQLDRVGRLWRCLAASPRRIRRTSRTWRHRVWRAGGARMRFRKR